LNDFDAELGMGETVTHSVPNAWDLHPSFHSSSGGLSSVNAPSFDV
jgi:hypothetical protein